MTKSAEEKAVEIARLVRDGKGADTVALDISQLNSWTDFFVIATVNSSAHWQGLERQVLEYAAQNDLEQQRVNKRISSGDEWNLIDLGNIVVHLMSKQARDFYDLEKLWHSGRQIEIG